MAEQVVEQNVGTGVVAPTTTETQPFAIPDDAMVEVVWKGEKVLKPWKEARNNIQMQEDYTRSKQELAKQAKELQEVYGAVKGREATIAEKEAALDAILGRTKPAEKKPSIETMADDDVVDAKTVKQLLQSQREEFDGKLTDSLSKARTEDAQARLFQRWEDLTSETVNALKKETPILGDIPQLDLLLKREALADKPQTESEMKQAIVKAGQRLAKKLDDAYIERRKAEVTRKKELTEKAPTLASGGPQFQAPKKSYGERGKISWDELERDAIEAVEALEE